MGIHYLRTNAQSKSEMQEYLIETNAKNSNLLPFTIPDDGAYNKAASFHQRLYCIHLGV